MSYAELHCLTNFSFLEAASHPDELVARAVELGYTALAITDRNSLAGVVRAHTAARDQPLKLIIGAEITPDDASPVILWAMNRQGYANLCRLITLGRRRAPKGSCLIHFSDLCEHTAGVLAGISPHPCTEQLRADELHRYRDLFGNRSYLLAELFQGPHDDYRLEWLQELSRLSNLPLVAAGNVLFHVPARKILHDVLTAIHHRTTVMAAGDLLLTNAQRHLQIVAERLKMFAAVPDAVSRTLEIAEQCTFSLDELRYEYPEELAPAGQTPLEYLKQLTWNGAEWRYPAGVPEHVRTLIEHELLLIEELHYEPYFLTVWDLVRFAKSKGILCQGRGSAANSVVCYCLGVTSVDPERIEVLFERFVSRERNEAPDIDVDFEHERREEVLQYIYDKYGRDRAGITAVTTSYRPRSAIRDVGKALGFSLDLVDRLAKNADAYQATDDFGARCQEIGLVPTSRIGRQFLYLVNELLGFPRHLSQHTGGMVITRGPLSELVPIENAVMEGRTVVQWNKDDLDDLGILKVDCLALGMLTAIRKCFDLVEKTADRTLTLANIPEGDPQVYDMICKADTVGVFQIESRAQMSMLPRLKPRCYYDLVIEVAIVRPGPIQGDMVHPYLRRRNNPEEEIGCPNKDVENVLRRTLGVPLFQEQCMQLAIVAAGFTPGEADQLRRAMGAWRRPGLIDSFRQKLLTGMQTRGLDSEFAEQVFRQIRGFGDYGFPESHAASFALLVYVSSYLKHYYPAEFAAALINSQPMGFYAPAQLIQDARRHSVEIRPIDVNRSNWDCTIEGGAVRLGLRLVKGLGETAVRQIEEARPNGGYSSIDDLLMRAQLSRAALVLLADADTLRTLSASRRTALWNAFAAHSRPTQLSLFDFLDAANEPSVDLPLMPLEEEVHTDYQTTGLTLRPHPLGFQRDWLRERGVLQAQQLIEVENGSRAKVAGIVLMRQRPATASGITFVTLEDETGITNLIVHPKIWERYRVITQTSGAWIVHGRVDSKDSVIHVIAQKIEDLSDRLETLKTSSRDFR